MTAGLTIADLQPADDLAAAFEDWPKQRSAFERYEAEALAGERDVIVARVDGDLAGYLTVY